MARKNHEGIGTLPGLETNRSPPNPRVRCGCPAARRFPHAIGVVAIAVRCVVAARLAVRLPSARTVSDSRSAIRAERTRRTGDTPTLEIAGAAHASRAQIEARLRRRLRAAASTCCR